VSRVNGCVVDVIFLDDKVSMHRMKKLRTQKIEDYHWGDPKLRHDLTKVLN